jgi:hypothetical protein
MINFEELRKYFAELFLTFGTSNSTLSGESKESGK